MKKHYSFSASKLFCTLCFFAAFIVPSGPIFSQSLDNFRGIKSQGPIPADLRKSLDELYMEDKQRVRDYNDGKLANEDKVLNASYEINQLMVSGRILYGDPLTQMINRIADTLLKDYPDLRKELRFYVVKSPEVNAFATGQGMVFINTGLISQVVNEAQLAFVISHEVIHYVKKHNLEILVRKDSKKKSTDQSTRDKDMRNFLRYHNRSHAMENTADSLGLIMFYLNSPYDKNVTDGFFDVLQYAYLPFDEVPFNKDYFDTPHFHLPSNIFLDTIALISARDDYDDTRSTHPNLKKRRERTAEVLSEYKGGRTFVTITPQEFHKMQTLARFECVRQELIYADNAAAFYNIFLLQREFPNNEFLIKAKAQSLYNLARYKNNMNSSNAIPDYKDFEGEVQQVYHMFRKINKQDLNIIAIRDVWNAHKLYPNDERLVKMLRDLILELKTKDDYTLSSFSTFEDTVVTKTEENPSEESNKYARIKKKKQDQKTTEHQRLAFADLFQQDPEFKRIMRSTFENAPDSVNFKPRKNIFLCAPAYYVINTKTDEINKRRSYRKETHLKDLIEQVTSTKKMGLVDFSDQSLRNQNSDQFYNEFVTINEWCGEFVQVGDNYATQMFTQPEMKTMMEKYDANTVDLTFVLNLTNYQIRDKIYYFYGLLFAPVTPLMGYHLFSNTERTIIHNEMIDIESGKTVSRHSYDVGRNDSDALIKSSLFDNFNNFIFKTK